MELALGALDHLGALLEDQDHGAADRAHVDRLVGGVQHQNAAVRPALPLPLGGQRGWVGWFFADLAGCWLEHCRGH